jgi:hypothetical protein
VEGEYAYWTNWGDGTIATANVKYGTSPTVLIVGQKGPVQIVVNSTTLFWSNFDGTIWSSPLSGGTPTRLVSGVTGPPRIAIDATRVYWTAPREGTVSGILLDGGAPQILATGEPDPNGVAVDSRAIYWTNFTVDGGGTVRSMPLSGGDAATLAFGGSPAIIVVDPISVYRSDYDGQAIMKVPLDGGRPTTLARGQWAAAAMTVDATSVYWLSNTDGTVMQLTPK